MWRGLTIAGAGILFCLSGPRVGADEFIVGLGTHSASEQGLTMTQATGVASLRDDIHWAEVEREKGVLVMPERYERYVDDALRHGLQPVLVLCYGNPFHDGGSFPVSEEAREAYTRFAEFVVAHFRGRVQRYEIWNEWNIGISLPPGTPHGQPEPYVALLRKVYPRLKAIGPEITVIGGALSGDGVEHGWLETACRAGLLESLDAFSFHPYCYRQSGQNRLPENGFFNQIRESQAVTRRYQKREVPIYITEVGWPTHDGPDGSTPEDSARFLARTYLLARTLPFVRGLWWYDLRDDGDDPHEREHHFGLLTRNWAPKPAYTVLTGICRLFREARFVGEIAANPALHVIEFRRESGAWLFAMWNGQEGTSSVVLETVAAPAAPGVKLHDFSGREIACRWQQDRGKWRLSWLLTGTPRVLEVDPARMVGATFRFDDGPAVGLENPRPISSGQPADTAPGK